MNQSTCSIVTERKGSEILTYILCSRMCRSSVDRLLIKEHNYGGFVIPELLLSAGNNNK